MKKQLICRFKGKNGSQGFIYGEEYIIETCCRQMVGQAYIHAEDKHAKKSCPYDSIESFLENWDVLAIL